VYSNLLWVCF